MGDKETSSLNNFKLMIVQPVNAEFEKTGDPIIAVDTVGSGPGEIIYYITASESVIPLPVDTAPVDASIVGIVDSVYSEKSIKNK